MKVIGWISYDEAADHEESIGGLGGFFERGMRWKDYADIYNDKGREYAEALRAAILERELRYSGSQHQNSHDGVPVFSDGTVATFSYRAWGDLMAGVWSEHQDQDYSYVDFYC